MLAAFALACTGPSTVPPLPTFDDTDPPTPPVAFPATCAVWPDNALRVWCDATLDAGPVTVELTPDAGGRVRTFHSGGEADPHVFVWGLTPSTHYLWRVVDDGSGEEVTGELTTGGLPVESAIFKVSASTLADDAQVEAVMVSPGCPSGTIYALDADGQVVWYQPIDQVTGDLGFVNTMALTDERTVLVSTGKSHVYEFDLQGRLLMASHRGEAFENYVHHELTKHDGIIYAIYAAPETIDGVDYVLDGLYAIDASTGEQIDDVWMGDDYTLDGEDGPWTVDGYWNGVYPDLIDAVHTNSVSIDPAGDVWVSMRHLHAFAKRRGGPGSAGFGELVWTAVGDPRSVVASASDFTLSGVDPTFTGQHDVHLAADGTVLLLDNGLVDVDKARAVRYAIDEGAGTLELLEAWDVGVFCPVQGSVRELPGGHLLVSCSTAGKVLEFAPGRPDPAWTLTATCRDLLPAQLPRAIPLSLAE